jgi:pimeloyl-ACP methyl ester carboxylesterase
VAAIGFLRGAAGENLILDGAAYVGHWRGKRMTQATIAMPGGKFREGAVMVDGVRIRVAQAGSGPVIVVLPTSAGLAFSPGIDRLAEDFLVIMLDPPGWGESPADEVSAELPELANTTAAAIAALGVAKYHLAGGSMGGVHALWVAARYPERILSLAVDGCMAFRRGHWSMPGMDPKAIVAAAARGDDVSLMLPPPHPEKPWATLEYRQKQFAKILRVMALVGPEFDDDLAARLQALQMPVLAIFGARDHFLYPSIGGVYETVIPNCKSVIIEGAAHDVPGEKPAAYAALVKALVLRAEAAGRG